MHALLLAHRLLMSVAWGFLAGRLLAVGLVGGIATTVAVATVALLLAPVNFLLQLIEFAAKTISHGMRLFGNMYAGELVFLLIALLGASAAMSLGGAFLFLGHVIAGSIWAIFHILIVVLQAFIFMMLTLVYMGQSHEGH